MSVIEVNHLTKDYGFGRGVFDVSFKIEKGEVFGFLGPNPPFFACDMLPF